jgi:hypothetical protein
MGTSANYGGPPNWGPVKASVTRAAQQGHLTQQKAATIMSNFVSAMSDSPRGGFVAGGGGGGGHSGGGGAGGGRGGRKSSSRSRGVHGIAASVGSFLSDVKERGLRDALRGLGIGNIDDTEPESLVLILADVLGGSGSTIDEVDLRTALCELLRELTKDLQDINQVETALRTAAANLEQVIRDLFGHYIFERFNTTNCANLDAKGGVAKTDSFLGEIKRFIDTQLRLEGTRRELTSVNWRGTEGKSIVEEILQQTIAVFTGEE